jgi:cytochrome c peroxidase
VRRLSLLCVAVLLTSLGCRPASRYGSTSPAKEDGDKSNAFTDRKKEPNPELTWERQSRKPTRLGRPIVFVSDKNAAEWEKLDRFWSKGIQIDPAALVPQLIPTGPVIVAPTPEVIRIKVPRGLDDPTPFIPEFNPPTDAKWELGRRLFFDRNYLSASHDISCADCHQPEHGFSRPMPERETVNTPTLLNVVYNRRQFWNGRAQYLEEVIAGPLDNEFTPDVPFHHGWGSAVLRLRDSPKYQREFLEIFGTPPTRDSIAKVLATYVRTILSGDSLHDRALHARDERLGKERNDGREPKPDLEVGDYVAVLNDAALKALDRADHPKNVVARELFDGYTLYRKLNCVNCHGGRQFTDGRFHNVGIGWKADVSTEADPNHYLLTGHLPFAPIGSKDRLLVGAYKTPTLRGRFQRLYYFHNGEARLLADAIVLHTRGFVWNGYLAEEMHEPAPNESDPRLLKLTTEEDRALLLFLKALDGEPVDAMVRQPAPEP